MSVDLSVIAIWENATCLLIIRTLPEYTLFYIWMAFTLSP